MASVEITLEDCKSLLTIFAAKSFEAGNPFEFGTSEHDITKKCELLFKLDYSLIELDNTNGAVSPRYPGQIFIPEYEHGHMASTITASCTSLFDSSNEEGSNGLKAKDTSPPSNNRYSNGSSNGSDKNGDCGEGSSAGGNGIQAYVTFANPPQGSPQPPFQHQRTIYEDLYDFGKIREHITMARYARCRQRFVVPAILYRGKYICRSATISVMPEAFTRKLVDYAYDYLSGGTNSANNNSATATNPPTVENEDPEATELQSPSQFSYEEVIKSDIQLLNALNVATIVDLMVEKRKIKYYMTVSSSEKADPENQYKDFNLISMPYPGCEFFKKYNDHDYECEKLQYDWSPSFNDAMINIPKLGPAADLDINWNDYEKWDLVVITQNYLKATLKYIQEENSGLLVHCISGWDRTPLFISLLRISLWADGLIHQSLNPEQMTYLTVAYDWYLFGHQLPDRLKRGEDIMMFCFHMLKYIKEDEFSLAEQRKRTTKTSSSSGSSVVVIKSDEDQMKEDYVLNFDQDSNDSFSNCSNCDMSITDNFFQTMTMTTTAITTTPQPPPTPMNATAVVAGIALTNRSPNPKRSRTSPISVPGGRGRQRYESTSSSSSWQVVTETGSIDSMANNSYLMQYAAVAASRNPQLQSSENGSVQSGNGIPMEGNGHGNRGSDIADPTSIDTIISGNNGDASATNGTTTSEDAILQYKLSQMSERQRRLCLVRNFFSKVYNQSIALNYKVGPAFTLKDFMS